MRLVYLSPVTWDSFAQRPHKFVEWIHRQTGEAVLWLDPYPTRFPNWQDWRRVGMSGILPVPSQLPWLKVLKPGGLPIEPLPGSAWINRLCWQRTLDSVAHFVSDKPALLAIGKPSVLALELLKRLPFCKTLYDAMDDFPAFYAGLSRLAFMHREKNIAQRVNVVWASSSALKSHWERLVKVVRFVPNGLDLSILPKIEPISTPRNHRCFGYVGTIASWFDWDVIYALAQARPNDEIRLIGPEYKMPRPDLPGNVVMLPACDHPSALKAMLEFDVGLIPFKRNKLSASVDPVKYYEYRALSLPVITTDFGEMQYRGGDPGVFLCRSIKEIPWIAEQALRVKQDADLAHTFALENSWESRFANANPLRL